MSKEFIYGCACDVGEYIIGYISGIGTVRFMYKLTKSEKLRATFRLVYNVVGLPLTIYLKGIGEAFNVIGISKSGEILFGEPVYIFDTNRLWIEQNFTFEAFGNITANTYD